MSDKEIEKLDFILDRLIQFGGHVSSNTLHQYGLYDEYNDDNTKIEHDFSLLQLEFYKSNASEIIDGQDDDLICHCLKTLDFKKKYGSFKNYYIKAEEEQKESELNRVVEIEKQKGKDIIGRRKNSMVNHNYWFVRPKNIIAPILFILAFVFGISNFKELKDYFQEDKEKLQTQDQESIQESTLQPKEIKSLEPQSKQYDTTELKTDRT